MADKLSAQFAKAHWVKYADGKHFCESPVTTRGVPHNLTPGIYKCCDSYLDALETLRKHAGREDAPMVDSLTCLSFSPWSQALPPVIEATADLSMRLCVRDPSLLSVQSGKAYLPDSTDEDEAIVREPLFRRPCQASISDNPFATSYEHVDSFFNLANSIVLMCRIGCMEEPHVTFGSEMASTLIMAGRVDDWVNGSGKVCNAVVCADILLMLNMMYPQTFGVGEDMILPCWAQAVPALHKKLQEQQDAGEVPVGAFFGDLGLDEKLVEQGRAWWKAFVRNGDGVWRHGPLGTLLSVLDQHNGSHNVDGGRYREVRWALEQSVQAAWLVASPDGVARPPPDHPASEASEPKKVRRPIIDPVFVGCEKRGVVQRGCLVGIKPHQLRQMCALAMGADLPGVSCQVCRNEGTFLCLEHALPRLDPCILTPCAFDSQAASPFASAAPRTSWTTRAPSGVPNRLVRCESEPRTRNACILHSIRAFFSLSFVCCVYVFGHRSRPKVSAAHHHAIPTHISC